MRNRSVGLLALLGLVVLLPGQVLAQTPPPVIENSSFCTANSLSVCMDFNLTDNGSGNYSLLVTYVSSSDGTGLMTAGGIYDIYSMNPHQSPNPSFTFSNVALDPSLTGWGLGCNGLSGAPASTFLACASTTNGSNDGLAPGGAFTITFTSSPGLTAGAFGPTGELGFRSHMQSLGLSGCSLKPDSRVSGNVVGGVIGANAECGGPSSTVPEPATLLLLGTGLFGLGGVRKMRRRKDFAEG